MPEETNAAAAIETQDKQSSSIQKVTLRKPFDFEGQKITVIDLDFDKLNGKMLRTIERQYLAGDGIPVPGKETSNGTYAIYCAAAKSDLPYEAFDMLGGQDYTEVVSIVQSFFLGIEISSETTS